MQRCLMVGCVLWLAPLALPVSAQVSYVTLVADAPIFVRPEASRTPLVVGKEGSLLRVLADEADWYRVEFDDPQWGRRVGYVRKDDVAVRPEPSREPVDVSVRDAPPVVSPAPLATAAEQAMLVIGSAKRGPVGPSIAVQRGRFILQQRITF